ncbi:MAG TPA: cysteine--tRNA ligase [Acidimicrobiales bacterium]|nr:cysteine--tRNA ligase [Acidimicrobiales bacterium]
MLRVFDTAKRQLVELETREPGKVSMYVCGPTVYDVPHLGHGRFAIVFDVIRRYLEWRGFEVRFVSNITDIEDKIITRAGEEGRSTDEVVAEYTAAWFDAMDALGVRRPDDVPTATGYVAQMVDYIAELVARGRAYETPDGVYLSVETVEGYGLLAQQDLDRMQAGGGERDIVGAEHKRAPLDFALWKKAKPGEPAWDSPWEPGRPGWHIECTVMSLDLLGEGFDIHGGGDDLRFPHHENERAQAVAAGRRFARYWLHNGMVLGKGGQKMSKSLGNYLSLTDLLARDGFDPRALRMLVLRAKYRSPVEVADDHLADAGAQVQRLDALARRIPPAAAGVEPDAAVVDRFRGTMDDDFNTPAAVAVLMDAVRDANTALDAGDEGRAARLAAAAFEIAGAVGLVVGAEAEPVPPEALEKARRRDEARVAKDWATADLLRDELVGAGFVVEDTPAGTTLRRP